MVRCHGLEHPGVNCGSPGDRVCEGLEVYSEDLPRVLGEVYVTLAQGEYGKDCVSWDCVSFYLNTKPLWTRRTTITAVRTGSSNHCLHWAPGSISSTLSFPRKLVDEIDCYCLKNFTEDFLNFLTSNSSSYLVLHLLILYHATCNLCMLYFIMMTMLLLCFSSTWVLIPLLVIHHISNSSSWNSSVMNL